MESRGETEVGGGGVGGEDHPSTPSLGAANCAPLTGLHRGKTYCCTRKSRVESGCIPQVGGLNASPRMGGKELSKKFLLSR